MSDTRSAPGGEAYELVRLDETTWIIRDPRLTESDPWHIVARITASGGEAVQVFWTRPSHRRNRYVSAAAVLNDLLERTDAPSSNTRPVPIPHFPPLKGR